MAYKYLDKTGLSYFWTKLKAWANGLFVHLSGNETISGYKTFTNYIVSKRSDPAFEGILEGYTKGDDLSDAKQAGLFVHDQTGNFDGDTRLGTFYVLVNTDKSIVAGISAYNNISGSIGLHYLRVTSNPDGTGYASCPTPATDDNSNKIATTAFVRAQGYLTSHQTLPSLSLTTSGSGNAITALSVSNHAITATKGSTFLTSHQSLANYVTLNSAQTISAVKTFTANPVLNQVGLNMTVKDSNSDTLRTHQILRANSTNTKYGLNLCVSGGSNTIVSGGESGSNQLSDLEGVSGEDLYLVADGNIYLKPNGNTWANAKTVTLDTSADLSGINRVIYNTGLYHENLSAVKGTNPSSMLYWTLGLCDKNGYGDVNTLGRFRTTLATNGVVSTYMVAFKNEANSTTGSTMGIRYDTANDVGYTFAPTPETSDNSTKIATTAFVKAQGYVTDNNKVRQVSGTGNSNRPILVRYNAADASETDNYAVYNDNVTINTNTGVLTNFTGHTINRTDITKGTNPSATKYWTLTFCDKDGSNYTNNCIGMLETSLNSTGVVKTYIRAMKNAAATATPCEIAVIYDTTNSTGYTQAPTPAVSDDSTKIATTKWVRDATGDFAFLSAYPYKLTTVSDTGLDRWSYNNIRDDTVSGFDQFVKTGRYHVNASPDTKSCPFTNRNSDGLLIVDNFSSAASASNYSRLLQVYHEISSTAATYAVWIRGAYYANSQWNFREWQRLALTTDDIEGNAATATKIQATPDSGGTFVGGAKTGGALVNATTTGYGAIWNAPTKNYQVACATHPSSNDTVYLCYSITDANISSNTNTIAEKLTWNANTGKLTATEFSGPLTGDVTGNCSGTAANVTGTVAIVNGGTGATDRLNAFKNLTNQKVGSSPAHFVTFTSSWAKAGYSSVADVKTALGLGSAAYTASTDYAEASHTHSYLPLAGGNITGNIKLNTTSTIGIYKGNATSLAEFSGGSALNKGARLALYGESHSSNAGRFDLIAGSASASKSLIGKPDGTLTWGGQAIQTSSDERVKTALSSVPDEVLDAWEDVEWGQFRYLDALEEKGGSARLHLGLIAQRAAAVFAARGLDACAYGILCYDAEEDMWTVRYAEALSMEAACLRRENARLKKRVAGLEERLAALELKIS